MTASLFTLLLRKCRIKSLVYNERTNASTFSITSTYMHVNLVISLITQLSIKNLRLDSTQQY